MNEAKYFLIITRAMSFEQPEIDESLKTPLGATAYKSKQVVCLENLNQVLEFVTTNGLLLSDYILLKPIGYDVVEKVR